MGCSKVTYRGWHMCSHMPPTIEMFEDRMRAERGWSSSRKLQIFQGSYNSSVSASADTHAAAGALDTEKLDDAGTLIARECGTTSWQRGSPEDSYFDDHNHWIWIGCDNVSTGAADQVDDYYAGKDGLADGYSDKSPRPDKIVTCQQALADYEGSGVLGMTDTDKWSRSVDQPVKADATWHTLKIDDEDALSLVTGPMVFVAICCLTVGGLAPGQVLQVRFQRVYDYSDNRATTVEASYPIKEIIGTQGDAFDQIVWGQYIGDNAPSGAKEKMRLYACAVDADCVVKGITTRVLHD